MHLINKNYIKINVSDFFHVMAYEKNPTIIKFFQKIRRIVMDNENPSYRNGEYHQKGICVSISDLINQNIFDISKLKIKRESIINASIIALYNDELDIAQKLSFFFEKSSYTKEELGNLADYVLENSMSILEYLYGISESFIYKENKNKIELGYIFDDDKVTHKSKKKVPKDN